VEAFMSDLTAKATRRDLRRAVGSEAVSVINAQTSVIDQRILPSIATLESLLGAQIDRITKLESRAFATDSLTSSHSASLALMRDFRARRFLQRLKWILTGR
jgi:hypothetical protein